MNGFRYILSPDEEKVLSDRAHLGAEILDQKCPDWFWKIDFQKLDMKDGILCIIGQLYKGFYSGLHALHWDLDKAQEYGVHLDGSEMTDSEWIAKFSELRECWIGEAADRISEKLLTCL